MPHLMSLILILGSVNFVVPILFGQSVQAVEPVPNCMSGELIGDPSISNAVQIVLSCTNLVNFAGTGTPEFNVAYKSDIKLHPENGVAYPYNASIVSGQLTLYFLASDGTFVRNIAIDAGSLLNSEGYANDNISISSELIVDHDKPAVNSNNYSISGVELNVSAADGVLNNDSDAEGSVHVEKVVTIPANGIVTLNLDGSFIYIPAVGYYGSDSFTYSAIDDAGNNNMATVYISDGQAEFKNISFYSNGLNSGYAKVGDTIRVNFETSEPVTVNNVKIAHKNAIIQLIDSTHFSAYYVMQESDTEGSIVYSITVHDQAGNLSSTTTEYGITFDKTIPVIDIGETNMILEIHEVYSETAVATDGETPIAVSATGLVNTNVPGLYTITYNAVDAAGNQADTVVRTVEVIDSIALAFDEISNNLAVIGIANNLNDVTTDNVTNFTGLYFEKSINGVKMGRITFAGPIDLSDGNTIAFLQTIGLHMNANTPGTIGMNLMDISGSEVFRGMAATIKFYGLDKIGFNNEYTSIDVYDRLIATDDEGNAIDVSKLAPTLGSYVGCNNLQIECYTFTVGVEHFTEYSFDNSAPTVIINKPTNVDKGKNVTFTGTIDDSTSMLTLTIGDKTYSIPKSNVIGLNWSYKINTKDFSAGTYEVKISATDPVGNIGVDATRLKINSIVIPHNDNSENATKPILDTDFNPGFVIDSSLGQESAPSALGVQTIKKDSGAILADSDVVVATANTWTVFGVAWYWWLLLFFVISLAWWVLF